MTDPHASPRSADPRTGLGGTAHPASGPVVEVLVCGLDMLSDNPAARAVGVVLAVPARGGRR